MAFKLPFKMPLISRQWRYKKLLIGLFVLELAISIGGLVIYGVASPNTYRTTLWQIGWDNGWNSNPKQILYAYANYRLIPTTPFVWSLQLTQYDMVVSVLCLFLLLVKACMFVMHLWWPILAVFINLSLTVLWAVAAWGQAGPDYSDPAHPSSIAWYVTKSCSYAKPYDIVGYCQQAQAGFAVAVLMAVVFFINLVFAVWSCIPTQQEKELHDLEIDDLMDDKASPVSNTSTDYIFPGHAQFQMPHPPPSAKVPYTPRTLAFNTLDRQLPLRQYN